MKKLLTSLFGLLLLSACTAPAEETSTPESTETSTKINVSTSDHPALVAADGFVILNAVASQDHAAYAEMSECVQNATNWSTLLEDRYVEGSPCTEWEYRVTVKNYATDSTQVIYETSSPKKSSFIPTAEAGGCPWAYLPYAWSSTGNNLILYTDFIPISCGSELSSNYEFASIPAEGGGFQDLANYGALFTSDFSKAIYTDNSENSPRFCGPGHNSGKIVERSVDTLETRTLLEESNSYYQLTQISDDNSTLHYKVSAYKVYGSPGECADVDTSIFEEKTVSL